MSFLHEPSRGGTRGGKDQFAWKDVEVDKHRENYLGNKSLHAKVDFKKFLVYNYHAGTCMFADCALLLLIAAAATYVCVCVFLNNS